MNARILIGLAALALAAGCALPPALLTIAPQEASREGPAGDPLAIPDSSQKHADGTATATFVIVPDQTASATWSAPPR